jgi:hypothetical protein
MRVPVLAGRNKLRCMCEGNLHRNVRKQIITRPCVRIIGDIIVC